MKPYFEKDGITLYHGDLREVLPQLDSVDCIVTDPPYGLSFMEKDWDQAVPGPEYWRAILAICKPGAMMLAFGGTRTFHRLTCAIEDAEWDVRDCLMWLYGSGFPKNLDIGKSVKQWQGWGTALKPAWEPIILAMKALDGTYANNTKHGVAGLNIDASRISVGDEIIHTPQSDPSNRHGTVGTDLGITNTDKGKFQAAQRESIRKTQELGRFPANLLLDEEAASILDDQTGTLTSGTNCVRSKTGGGYHGGFGQAGDVQITYGDSGGASRFFYCAKAAKKEKGEGNDHPTVKPLGLMKYLLTLLSTPTGGVILDPFAGSGTTALAAKQLGRHCICVELDEHNCEIAARRLA
jgi:site-specific DNA-methyltransferase (adenine-specific)